MKYRVLGRTGLSVGEIGFGCEGMVEHPEWTEAFIDVMEAHGANCIDLYAPHPDFRDDMIREAEKMGIWSNTSKREY